MTNNSFDLVRAIRFKTALERFGDARRLEILPLLCMAAKSELYNMDVYDLAAGTGFLGEFFDGVAGSVTYVDQSSDMINQLKCKNANTVVCDIYNVSKKCGENKADIITCISAFHHINAMSSVSDMTGICTDELKRFWATEKYMSISECRSKQYETIKDWLKLLKPGGLLLIMDCPGYPDKRWGSDSIQINHKGINTYDYYKRNSHCMNRYRVSIDTAVLEVLFSNKGWSNIYNNDPFISTFFPECSNLDNIKNVTLRELIEGYRLPLHNLNERGYMIPTDYFDEIFDCYGASRHFAYFARESEMEADLRRAGYKDIFSHTLPAPFVFSSHKEAVWFFHEAFGFGEEWLIDNIPEAEYISFKKMMDEYFGFYMDGYGRELLFWQQTYYMARAPE